MKIEKGKCGKKIIQYENWGKKYELSFMLWHYTHFNNLYVWLSDYNEWDFCDISANYWALGTNEIQLDHDFIDFTPEIKDYLVELGILKWGWLWIYKVDVKKIKKEFEFYEYK